MDERPIIAMSCMGTWGRFANSLFQYNFAHIYAKKHNFRIQTPPWIGQFLFGHNDPPITVGSSSTVIYDGIDISILNQVPNPSKDIAMYGYFQCHTKF